jgi:aspartate carbamoyltransferase catalytic subunit
MPNISASNAAVSPTKLKICADLLSSRIAHVFFAYVKNYRDHMAVVAATSLKNAHKEGKLISD